MVCSAVVLRSVHRALWYFREAACACWSISCLHDRVSNTELRRIPAWSRPCYILVKIIMCISVSGIYEWVQFKVDPNSNPDVLSDIGWDLIELKGTVGPYPILSSYCHIAGLSITPNSLFNLRLCFSWCQVSSNNVNSVRLSSEGHFSVELVLCWKLVIGLHFMSVNLTDCCSQQAEQQRGTETQHSRT